MYEAGSTLWHKITMRLGPTYCLIEIILDILDTDEDVKPLEWWRLLHP